MQLIQNPEDIVIAQEELREIADSASRKIDVLIRITFHRPELFEAWYAKNIMSASLRMISELQHISRRQAKKRVETAQEIVYALRNKLHEIDD